MRRIRARKRRIFFKSYGPIATLETSKIWWIFAKKGQKDAPFSGYPIWRIFFKKRCAEFGPKTEIAPENGASFAL